MFQPLALSAKQCALLHVRNFGSIEDLLSRPKELGLVTTMMCEHAIPCSEL